MLWRGLAPNIYARESHAEICHQNLAPKLCDPTVAFTVVFYHFHFTDTQTKVRHIFNGGKSW